MGPDDLGIGVGQLRVVVAEQPTDALVPVLELGGVPPLLGGPGAEDALAGLPVADLEGEALAELAPDPGGQDLAVGVLGGDVEHDAGRGSDLGQIGEVELCQVGNGRDLLGAAAAGRHVVLVPCRRLALEEALDLVDGDNPEPHVEALVAGQGGGELGLGAAVVREGLDQLLAAVHLVDLVLQHFHGGPHHGRAHAGPVPVGDALERLPGVVALQVRHDDRHVRVEGGCGHGDTGGEGLAHAGLGTDQEAGEDEGPGDQDALGVDAEGEALPEVEAVHLGEGSDGGLLGVGILVGDPQHQAALLDLLDVEAGGDDLELLDGLGHGHADRQDDPGGEALAVAVDAGGLEGDRVLLAAEARRGEGGDDHVGGDGAHPGGLDDAGVNDGAVLAAAVPAEEADADQEAEKREPGVAGQRGEAEDGGDGDDEQASPNPVGVLL